MNRDRSIQDPSPTPQSDQCGELYRHVVLPAGNLRCAIDQYMNENGRGLDGTTLSLLAATRDILGDISRKGTALAADRADTGTVGLEPRRVEGRWRDPLFTEG
ncbi:MAG: hypothetical protein AAF501_02280 [Pseudomonadota bacterium]